VGITYTCIQVRSEAGKIAVDQYVNPLNILPYTVRRTFAITVLTKSIFFGSLKITFGAKKLNTVRV